MYICKYTHTHTHTLVCVCVCVCVWVCVCVFEFVYRLPSSCGASLVRKSPKVAKTPEQRPRCVVLYDDVTSLQYTGLIVSHDHIV